MICTTARTRQNGDWTKFTEVWSAFVRNQYRRIPDWYGGYPSAQRYLWAPGRIIEFSEDPAFMLSPRFHDEMVMPSHREVVQQVEYPYIHLHSTQLHTLDRLLEMEELPAIELTPDHGASIPDLIPTIAKIQERKPVIVHAFFTVEEMRMIVERVPPEGLCVIGGRRRPTGPGGCGMPCWAGGMGGGWKDHKTTGRGGLWATPPRECSLDYRPICGFPLSTSFRRCSAGYVPPEKSRISYR